MNTALKLIPATHRPHRLPSDKQADITANFSLIARTWRTLTQDQRDSFCAFGQTWSPNPKKSTISGFLAFQSLNGVRLNSGHTQILTDAPAQPDFIAKFPTVTLSAQISPAATGLTLTKTNTSNAPFRLLADGPSFTGPVLVYATRPLSAGTGQPSPRLFCLIASLPGPATDLSDSYLTQFPAPVPGMKVAVQFVPVTPNGFRGNPFTRTLTVTS